MAGVKISELPLVTTLEDSDELLLVRGDSSRKVLGTSFAKQKDIVFGLSAVNTQIETLSTQTINVFDGPIINLSYNNQTRTLSADIGVVPISKGGTGQTNYNYLALLVGSPTGSLEQRQLSAGSSSGLAIDIVDTLAGKYITLTNTSQYSATNLSNTRTDNAIVIQSSTGSNTTLPAATLNLAGVMTPSDKSQLSTLWSYLCSDNPYSSTEQQSLTGIRHALDNILYTPPSIAYFRNNNQTSLTFEVGQTLATSVLTWSSNKIDPRAITNYTLVLANNTTQTGTHAFSAFTDNNNYRYTTLPGTATQSTFTWTISAIDWRGARAASSVIATWFYRVYYGKTSQSSPNAAQILAGTQESVLATTRQDLGEKIITPSNEYIFVAYPQRFGLASLFKVNGLASTDFTRVDISNFSNQYGGTADYYVYRSNNLLNSTYTLEIII